VPSDSGAYQLRYQMLITAPDRLEEPDVRGDPGWGAAMSVVGGTIGVLKTAMRDDLSALPWPARHDVDSRGLIKSASTRSRGRPCVSWR
jgi:hypothetical protein